MMMHRTGQHKLQKKLKQALGIRHLPVPSHKTKLNQSKSEVRKKNEKKVKEKPQEVSSR
jgi:hypothetical protein